MFKRARKRELRAFAKSTADAFGEMYEIAKVRGSDDPIPSWLSGPWVISLSR